MVCYRVMYDDVNETFWSVDRVHAFLPEGCAHTATRHVSSKPGTARGAYVHFRQLLLNAKKKGTVDTLRNYFHKTYFEHTGWVHLFEAFSRVIVFHFVMLHITVVVAFVGFDWRYLSTVVITHALLKALRNAGLMYTLWPLKRAEQDAAQSSMVSAKLLADRARAFNSFVRNGVARIVGFLIIPLAFVLEEALQSWSISSCLSASDWCDIHVRGGIADSRIPSCVGSDGTDFLLQFCTDCRSSVVSRVHCGILTRFATECATQCNTEDASYSRFFQVLAAVYATTFLGSAVIFTRPGSLARFKWYPHGDSDSFGLEAPFIATPELLRVPLGTAARYYFVWGVTLGIKISFGYYFLVSPLVEPVTFIAKADFSCWTWSSEMCPVTLDEKGTMGQVRSIVLKSITLGARLSVPFITYFLDTCLWFTWILSGFSSAMGWRMGLGKVAYWSDIITKFGESCALFHEVLMPAGYLPHTRPFELMHTKYLTVDEMTPTRIPEALEFISVEARSIQWQRWGRVWNELIFNLRARDFLSNTERDELIFVPLREPEHVDFFGTVEYQVFPAMLSSAVFYHRLWRYKMWPNYPHAVRTLVQMRDLFSFLLIALGFVDFNHRTVLLQAFTTIAKRVAASKRTSSDVLAAQIKLREEVVELLRLLTQLSITQQVESAFSHQISPVHAVNLNRDRDSMSAEIREELRAQMKASLEAVKSLVSSDTKIDVSAIDELDEAFLDQRRALEAYRQLYSLISLDVLLDDSSWEKLQASLKRKACRQILQILNHSLTSSNAGAEPSNFEAQRQILFFCNSMRNVVMPKAIAMRKMRTVSSFTPHYSEDVSYSADSLHIQKRQIASISKKRFFFSTQSLNMVSTCLERAS